MDADRNEVELGNKYPTYGDAIRQVETRREAFEETLESGNPVTMGSFERASAAGWKAPLPDYAERVRQGAMAGPGVDCGQAAEGGPWDRGTRVSWGTKGSGIADGEALFILGEKQANLPPSMAEEAYKLAQNHAEIAEKAIQAADFLRKHPEFEEFIRLIRKGSIQI
jgi:hypothetical protein